MLCRCIYCVCVCQCFICCFCSCCVYPILVLFKIINTYIYITLQLHHYIISIVQNIKFNITLVDILLLVGWLLRFTFIFHHHQHHHHCLTTNIFIFFIIILIFNSSNFVFFSFYVILWVGWFRLSYFSFFLYCLIN